MLPRLQIILLCSILVAATSCNSKLFLKRKYTAGKFFDLKKHRSAVATERKMPDGIASAFDITIETIPSKKSMSVIFPDYKEEISSENRERTSIYQKPKDSLTAKYRNQEKKKLYTPATFKKTNSGMPCAGLFYTSPEAQIAGFLVSIALLLALLPFMYVTSAVLTIKVLCEFGAAVLDVIGIGTAFRAISQGGLGNAFSAVFTILLGLCVLFLCVLMLLA